MPYADIQSAFDAHAEGTQFCVQAGEYRVGSLRPKARQRLKGVGRVVLKGSVNVSALTWASGGGGQYWSAIVPEITGVLNTSRTDKFGNTRAEEVFIDEVRQTWAGTLAGVGPGEFFIDYTTNRVYVGSNPSGKLIEVSVKPSCFNPAAGTSEIWLENIEIKQYANGANALAAVNLTNAPNSTLRRVTVKTNHGTGVRLANGCVMELSVSTDNGESGVRKVSATGSKVIDSQVEDNNVLGFTGAGGVIADTSTFSVERTRVSGNMGYGIRSLRSPASSTIDNNIVENNLDAGIAHELGLDVLITNNTATNNGGRSGTQGEGAQILIASSGGTSSGVTKNYTRVVNTVSGLINAVNSGAVGDKIGIVSGTYNLGTTILTPKANMLIEAIEAPVISALAYLGPSGQERAVGTVRPKVIIQSTGEKVFYQGGPGVTIRGLDLSGTSGPNLPQGDPNRDVQRGSLIASFDINLTVQFCYLHDCTNHGGGGNATGLIVEHTEMARCGSSEWTGTSAGGFKSADNATYRYNYAHDCVGNGMWVDVDGNVDAKYNIVVDNYRGGIRQEQGTGYCQDGPAFIEHNLLGGNNWSGVAANSGDAAVNSSRGTSVSANKAVRTLRTNYDRSVTGTTEGVISGQVTGLVVGNNTRTIRIDGVSSSLNEGRMYIDLAGSRGCGGTTNMTGTHVAGNWLSGGTVDGCGHGGSTCGTNFSGTSAFLTTGTGPGTEQFWGGTRTDIEVFGNTVTADNSGYGIAVLNQPTRTDHKTVQNIVVHDNVVWEEGLNASGLPPTTGSWGDPVPASVQFLNNEYHVNCDERAAWWTRNNAAVTWSTWQGAGQDVGGSFICETGGPTEPVDTTAPSVTWTTSSGTKSGTITLQGAATDASGVATPVKLLLDGVFLANATGTNPFTYSFNTTTVANGTHTIVAQATDLSSRANVGSASLTINVSNTAPVTSDVWIAGGGDITPTSPTSTPSQSLTPATELMTQMLKSTTVINGVTVNTPVKFIFANGDLVYSVGDPGAFAERYHPAWGSGKALHLPSPGNHECSVGGTQGIQAQFSGYDAYYFQGGNITYNTVSNQSTTTKTVNVGAPLSWARQPESAGKVTHGTSGIQGGRYYYRDLGPWLFISLDSNPQSGCDPGDPQYQWLQGVLANTTLLSGKKIFAQYHHPTWDDGAKTGYAVNSLFTLLLNARTDIITSGHTHEYERYGRMGQTGPSSVGPYYFVLGNSGHEFSGQNFTDEGAIIKAARSSFGIGKFLLSTNGFKYYYQTNTGAVTDKLEGPNGGWVSCLR